MLAMSKSARLKIKRANSHINTIARDFSPLSRDLYEITNGPGRSHIIMLEPDGFYLTYRPKQLITDHFGPIIGDCVNNLREAMDYSDQCGADRYWKAPESAFPVLGKMERP